MPRWQRRQADVDGQRRQSARDTQQHRKQFRRRRQREERTRERIFHKRGSSTTLCRTARLFVLGLCPQAVELRERCLPSLIRSGARDRNERKGQIAHLNHDPSDNRPMNLVFLCIDHHDEYDRPTRLAKGLTSGEVLAHDVLGGIGLVNHLA